MTVAKLIDELSKLNKELEVIILLEKSQFPIQEIREGTSHFLSETIGETDEYKFALIKI